MLNIKNSTLFILMVLSNILVSVESKENIIKNELQIKSEMLESKSFEKFIKEFR